MYELDLDILKIVSAYQNVKFLSQKLENEQDRRTQTDVTEHITISTSTLSAFVCSVDKLCTRLTTSQLYHVITVGCN